ncbi:MAG: hydrolase [Calditrichia bacterium]
MPRITIYIDVDDTIVRSTGKRNFPRPDVIAKLKELAVVSEVDLFLWSSGGADYARSVAEELGITSLFKEFLPKPTIAIDDVPIQDWRYLRQLHPNEFMGISIDELTGSA